MNSSAIDCEEIETLVYKRLDGRERGWRLELLVEQLTSSVEQKLLLCRYCSGLMRDACLIEKEGKQEVRCFVCIPEGVTWQPALINREAIDEKIIMCPLRERGCAWRGAVSRGIQHLKECGFLPVLCPLKCVESEGERSGEVVRVERRLVAEHEREYCPQRELRCEFCARGVRACEMNPHLGECSGFPVDCPNGCDVAGETRARKMRRGDVPLHLAECPLQTVKCPYWDYGCGEEMERRQLDLHEREAMHIHFRLAMGEMRRKEIESSDRIRFLEEQNTQLKNDSNITTNAYYLLFLFILSLLDAKNKAQDKISALEKLTAEQDLELKVLKESVFTHVSTGKLEWKIRGVKQLKEATYSNPFYVGLYKCQGQIEWNVNNSGDVGCLVRTIKGRFDDKLKWPFIYRFKFVLLNQNRNEEDYIRTLRMTIEDLHKFPECFQRPTEIPNKSFGILSFISHTELLTKKYCKEDSLCIHIIVEQQPSF